MDVPFAKLKGDVKSEAQLKSSEEGVKGEFKVDTSGMILSGI